MIRLNWLCFWWVFLHCINHVTLNDIDIFSIVFSLDLYHLCRVTNSYNKDYQWDGCGHLCASSNLSSLGLYQCKMCCLSALKPRVGSAGVVICLFHVFAIAPLKVVLSLSPVQQSGIHCQMICVIQLVTLNIFGSTWKYIYSLHITQC